MGQWIMEKNNVYKCTICYFEKEVKKNNNLPSSTLRIVPKLWDSNHRQNTNERCHSNANNNKCRAKTVPQRVCRCCMCVCVCVCDTKMG